MTLCFNCVLSAHGRLLRTHCAAPVLLVALSLIVSCFDINKCSNILHYFFILKVEERAPRLRIACRARRARAHSSRALWGRGHGERGVCETATLDYVSPPGTVKFGVLSPTSRPRFARTLLRVM